MRVSRASNENMYLTSAHRAGSGWLFYLMGSRGESYRVLMGGCTYKGRFVYKLKCSCPDFQANDGRTCKHIYFLTMRVGKETGLANRHDDEVFTREFFDKLEGILDKRGRNVSKTIKRQREKQEECLICSRPIIESDACWDCVSCKNCRIHSGCANSWFTKPIFDDDGNMKPPSCPMCRVKLNDISFKPALELHESARDPFVYFRGATNKAKRKKVVIDLTNSK